MLRTPFRVVREREDAAAYITVQDVRTIASWIRDVP
jgi:hypothetical protein